MPDTIEVYKGNKKVEILPYEYYGGEDEQFRICILQRIEKLEGK